MKYIHSEKIEDIGERVRVHKDIYYNILVARYRELLPSLIYYKTSQENNRINFYNLEYLLRDGKKVVIGVDYFNQLKLLGTTEKTFLPYENETITKSDIDFFGYIRPKDTYALIAFEYPQTGNCVIIENKKNSHLSDFSIVNFYAEELSEIERSRYSLILQSKVNTILRGDEGSESIALIANDLYNGKPYIKTGFDFDPMDSIIPIENKATEQLVNLKKEYNNKLTELNNMLGINSSALDKESGISDEELNSNNPYTVSNSNIYLLSREESFKKIYLRYGIKIVPYFNSEVLNESILQENENSNNLWVYKKWIRN